jgi:hypothetical protein
VLSLSLPLLLLLQVVQASLRCLLVCQHKLCHCYHMLCYAAAATGLCVLVVRELVLVQQWCQLGQAADHHRGLI